MHGRKGPKADLTVAGTATKFLYSKGVPLVVAKDSRRRGDDLKGSYRFGVCFDGSESSVKALNLVVSMAADHDNITVVTCKEPLVDDAKMKDKVKDLMGTRRHEHVVIEREVNHTIYQRIKQYLKDEMNDDNYIDFVAVGSKGAASVEKDTDDYIGSVATLVLQARQMNCIFVT